MASDCCHYRWKASKVQHIIPKSKSLPANVFYIQIRSRDYVKNQNLHAKNVTERFEEPTSPLKFKSLFVDKDSLLNKEREAQEALRDVLGFMNIPTHLLNRIIDDVITFGRRTADVTPGQDVLPIVINFAAITMETTDENDVPTPESSRARADMPVAKRKRV